MGWSARWTLTPTQSHSKPTLATLILTFIMGGGSASNDGRPAGDVNLTRHSAQIGGWVT